MSAQNGSPDQVPGGGQTAPPPSLLPQHARLLAESGVTPEARDSRGYWSATEAGKLASLGFRQRQCRVPALVIPLRNLRGQVVTYEIRPDNPRKRREKPICYEVPEKTILPIDFPPLARTAIADPTVPLYIVNGVRKADATVSRGQCCVALVGDWCWGRRDNGGERRALPEWDSVPLENRNVYLVFDGGSSLSRQSVDSLHEFTEYLEGRGATVFRVFLPSPDGKKVGLDDFLASGHNPDELPGLVRDGFPPPQHCPYRYTPDGIVWDKPTSDGPVEVQLTNFSARIVADVRRDDGVDVQRTFEVEATVDGNTIRFQVSAAEFGSLTWVATHLGPQAVIYPRRREDAAVAIQLLSGVVSQRRVITTTGWVRDCGHWGFAHAGGILWAGRGHIPGSGANDRPSHNVNDANDLSATGTVGPVPTGGAPFDNFTTDLSASPLAGYHLPDPPTGEELAEAVKASLEFLDLGPDRVTMTVYAQVVRSAIGPTNFSVQLAGQTGGFKSALAACVQQHYGPALTAEHFVANFSSTANALEETLCSSRDVLIVFDELVVNVSDGDAMAVFRKAERVVRAQGNSSSRQRMRAGGGLTPEKRPRGSVLITGEDIPVGPSLQARLLIVPVQHGDILVPLLSKYQAIAARGLCAKAMAGFIRRIAPFRDNILQGFPKRVRQYRSSLLENPHHRRIAHVIAELLTGFEVFLDFARKAKAIDKTTRELLYYRCRRALLEVADAQPLHTEESDPVEQLRAGLAAAIAGGDAHIIDSNGGVPEEPQGWGYVCRNVAAENEDEEDREVWIPQGHPIGWIVGTEVLYLEPNKALAVAKAAWERGGGKMTVTRRVLFGLLKQRGVLEEYEEGRQRNTVRMHLDGKRRTVLALSPDFIFGPQVSEYVPHPCALSKDQQARLTKDLLDA